VFSSQDPEGLAFGQGKLFIVDDLGKEVYIVEPGVNSVFDGVSPAGDDLVSHFDILSMNLRNPEGIEFNPDNNTLFIVSSIKEDKQLIEATITGTLVAVYDLSFLGNVRRSGLALGPASQDSEATHLYLTIRGGDNNTNPNENDGKIFELSLGSPSTPTPTYTETATPTETLTPTPSDTPTPTDTETPTLTPTETDTPTPTDTETPPTANETPTRPATNRPLGGTDTHPDRHREPNPDPTKLASYSRCETPPRRPLTTSGSHRRPPTATDTPLRRPDTPTRQQRAPTDRQRHAPPTAAARPPDRRDTPRPPQHVTRPPATAHSTASRLPDRQRYALRPPATRLPDRRHAYSGRHHAYPTATQDSIGGPENIFICL
jgi:hypothetical protein